MRSESYGDSLRGVLFKGLPEVINEHIHNWHLRCIKKFLTDSTPKTLLDVGCGYGRLSEPLIKVFPGLKATGVDLSERYIQSYKKRLNAEGYVVSVESMPSSLGTFDCVLAVTVLMYVAEDKLVSACESLLKCLAEGGKLIIVERDCSGNFFLDPFGIRQAIKNKHSSVRNIETGGRCFNKKNIQALFVNKGAIIRQRKRIPFTTFFIIPLYFICRFLPISVSKIILKIASLFDCLLEFLPLPSLHTAYLIDKEMK